MNEAGARLLEYVRSDVQLARDIYKTYLKSMQTIEAVQAKSSKVSKSDYVAVVEVDSALADARKEHSQNAQTAAMLFNKAMSHFPVAVADTLVRVAHIQNEQTAALSTQLACSPRPRPTSPRCATPTASRSRPRPPTPTPARPRAARSRSPRAAPSPD